MDDYISREALKPKIRAVFPSLEDRCRINEIVNSIPAANLEPSDVEKCELMEDTGQTAVHDEGVRT